MRVLPVVRSLWTAHSLKSSPRFALRMETSSALLTCQKDAYLTKGLSKLLFCEKKSEADDGYRVLLEDSVLYPEGGGQPCDLGTVNGVPVLKVSKPAEVPCELASSACAALVEVELAGPLQAEIGAEVECEVDWARRYDFMQQHTAQHLFSAVADLLCGAQTAGWAMGGDSCTVDLVAAQPLTAEQLTHIEDEVNARIRRGSAVQWKVFSRSALENMDGNPELTHFRGEVKGAAAQMSELRLVSIADLDVNPCGGTHLRSLGEINVFKVLGTEKDRGAVRVRFVAGQQAIEYFRACVDREAAMSAKLSAPPADHLSMVEKMAKDRKDIGKRYDIYSEELAVQLGRSLASSAPPLVVQHRAGADLKFLIKAGTTALEASPASIVLISGDDNFPVVPGSKPAKAASKPLPGPFVLYGEPDKVDKVKDRVLELLGGRAGGRPGRLQGQGSSLQRLEETRSAISELLQI